MVQSNGVFSLFHNFLSEIMEIGNNVEDKFWVNSFNFYIYISWILLDIRFYCYYYYFLFKTVHDVSFIPFVRQT